MLIRIFSIPKGIRLYSLKKPVAPSDVFFLSFNSISTLIGVAGNPGCLYIYQLIVASTPKKIDNNNENRYRGYGYVYCLNRLINRFDGEPDSDFLCEEDQFSQGYDAEEFEETKKEPTLCGLWCGIKPLMWKLVGLFVSKPIEKFTACNLIQL